MTTFAIVVAFIVGIMVGSASGAASNASHLKRGQIPRLDDSGDVSWWSAHKAAHDLLFTAGQLRLLAASASKPMLTVSEIDAILKRAEWMDTVKQAADRIEAAAAILPAVTVVVAEEE